MNSRTSHVQYDVASQASVVFVDLETAGIEHHRPIMQIAAIAVDADLRELEQFEIKVQFDEKKACPDALRKIHYRRAEWKRVAVPEKRAAWSFAAFLRRHASVVVIGRDFKTFRVAKLAAHNAQFDGEFLKKWFNRLGVFLPASYRTLCTLQRAYWYFLEKPELVAPDDFRLVTLCEYFGIGLCPADAHEALADVRATVALYRVIAECQRSGPATNERYSSLP